jgi:hypothetical protein
LGKREKKIFAAGRTVPSPAVAILQGARMMPITRDPIALAYRAVHKLRAGADPPGNGLTLVNKG